MLFTSKSCNHDNFKFSRNVEDIDVPDKPENTLRKYASMICLASQCTVHQELDHFWPCHLFKLKD